MKQPYCDRPLEKEAKKITSQITMEFYIYIKEMQSKQQESK